MASRRRLDAAPVARRLLLLLAMLLVLSSVAAFGAESTANDFDRSTTAPIAKPLSASAAATPAVAAAAEAAEREALAGLAQSKRAEAAAAAVKDKDKEEGKASTFSSAAASSSSPSSPLPPPLLADSSPPVVPDPGAEESAALLDAIKEIEEEEAEAAEEAKAAAEEEAEEAKAVASEPAPEAKGADAAAAAAAPSPWLSSSSGRRAAAPDFDGASSSELTPEERERKEAAAADLSLARSRGDAAAAAVAFARLRDADAERDSDADEEDEEEEEREREREGREKKWRPFKMRDQSEDEEEEEERREAAAKKESSSAEKTTAAAAATTAKRQQQQQQQEPHIAPPFDPRWPSPAGVAFAALPGAPQSLSLSSALPPEYDATVGGRGLPLTKNSVQLTSFAAARAAREALRRADRYGREPEDLMAAENERPRPRRETMLTAGLIGVARANAYGAKPDDIPVVAPTPLAVSEWKSAQGLPKPRDGREASRVVVDRSSSSAPFELSFAANAAVDQPTRRFRPPDQSLCVGAGVVITGNNLILRTWDAATGAPLQGPIAQPDFFGLDGNFSDPVCIYDSQDSKRFFVGVFRFGEGATKYSQFILSVSKTSNPADGFLGPYIFRNDGLDREGKPLPGLDDCGGSDDEEEANKKGVATEKKGSSSSDSSKKAAKKAKADDDDDNDEKDDDFKSDRAEAAAAAAAAASAPLKKKKKVSPGCLGDYPAVGLDANAFVATFNLFQTEPEEKYAGVLLLAIDKRGLLSGAVSQPAFVAYSNFNAEISYTVQPSQTQAGTPHDPSRGGTIYLASTGPCTQNEPNVNMVAAWALTNTSSLNTPGFGVVAKTTGGDSAALSPSWTIPSISKAALVEVPAYRDPGAFKAERLAMPQPEPGSPLDSGDARTLQLVLSGGVLWFAAQTAAHVGAADAPLSVAVVYFALLPSWNETASAVEGEEEAAAAAAAGNSVLLSSSAASASKQQQQQPHQILLPGARSNRHSAAFSPRLVAAGYLAAPGGVSLARPAITAEADGTAWVSALLTGPSTYPTQVAARADLLEGPTGLFASVLSPVILAPTIPDKKFKGSSNSGNAVNGAGNKTGTLRAGDYGGATLDEQGNVWLAGMWSGGVPSASCVAKFTAAKCPSWGTLVNKIKGGGGGGGGKASSSSSSSPASSSAAAARAASLGTNGVVISAKGVAGPSVPGARAGEWAAKAAKAKRAMEEREREEREEKELEAAATAAESPSLSASAPAAALPLVPSAITYDPDDVPERVVGESGSSGGGRR